MNDSFAQHVIKQAIEHGDAYTPDMLKILQRVIDRHELAKDAAYLKWEAGIDDADTD